LVKQSIIEKNFKDSTLHDPADNIIYSLLTLSYLYGNEYGELFGEFNYLMQVRLNTKINSAAVPEYKASTWQTAIAKSQRQRHQEEAEKAGIYKPPSKWSNIDFKSLISVLKVLIAQRPFNIFG